MDFRKFKIINGIIILSEINNEFSDKYLAIRKKENRVLTDDEVKILPLTNSKNSNYKEWKVRKKTADRFIKYLQAKDNKLTILDIGCGNGWFSHKMSQLKHNILGLDVNLEELEQANRVFKNEFLQFVYADIFDLKKQFLHKFDIITLNASVQYFSNFDSLKKTLIQFLKSNGEIHILDSPFYYSNEIPSAKQRTLDYYTKIGFPEMAKYYFHHVKEKIKDFDVLYQPKSSLYKIILRQNDSPFMWVRYNLEK